MHRRPSRVAVRAARAGLELTSAPSHSLPLPLLFLPSRPPRDHSVRRAQGWSSPRPPSSSTALPSCPSSSPSGARARVGRRRARARRVACARPVGRPCACAPAHPQRNARPKTRRQRSIYGCARTPDAAQDARPSGGLAHAPAVGRASFAASAGASAQVCAPARVVSRATRLLVGPRARQAVLVRLSHAGRAAD